MIEECEDTTGYELGIIIINFRTPEMTINCIDSVLTELQSLDCRVVVVDNNSEDDSCARVVHLIGGSSKLDESKQQKKMLPRYYYESRTRFFYPAYGVLGLTIANLCWMSGRLVSKLRQLVGRKD